MRTELELFGRHTKFASRVRRRCLVALIYAGFVAYLATAWFVDQSGFSTMIWIPLLMGVPALIFARLTGRYRSKRILWRHKAPSKSWIGRFLFPEDADLRDMPDERELRLRDQAHSWSYHVLNLGILWIWILIFLQRQGQIHERAWPALAVRHPWITDNLLFGVAAILLFAALTLPDSIILWFMPDKEKLP
jgi:hypothetical protein